MDTITASPPSNHSQYHLIMLWWVIVTGAAVRKYNYRTINNHSSFLIIEFQFEVSKCTPQYFKIKTIH